MLEEGLNQVEVQHPVVIPFPFRCACPERAAGQKFISRVHHSFWFKISLLLFSNEYRIFSYPSPISLKLCLIIEKYLSVTIMTRPPVTVADIELERTDLGINTLPILVSWIRGEISGRCASLFLSSRLESSLRLKREDEGRTDAVQVHLVDEFLSGGILLALRRAVTVYKEWFVAAPSDMVAKAFSMFDQIVPMELTHANIPKINCAFRRISLRSKWASTMINPSRPMDAYSEDLGSLHVALEIVRAHLWNISPVHRVSSHSNHEEEDDIISRELRLTSQSFTEEVVVETRRVNVVMEEYLIILMKHKSRGIEILAELNESSVYSVLGLSPSASDSEVKKAFKALAMQLHPDKGGDTELFQQLTDAYEKILEKRGIHKSTMSDLEPERAHKPNHNHESEQTSEDSKGPSRPDKETYADQTMSKVISSADDCVKSAKLTSELASKVASLLSSPSGSSHLEIRPLLVMLIKALRICGYASLDTSSAALDAARSVSGDVRTENLSTVTGLAGELMNAGFDCLNTNLAESDNVASDITLAASKAVSNAKIATMLAKAVESLTEEKSSDYEHENGDSQNSQSQISGKHSLLLDSEARAAIDQRISNAHVLRKLNEEAIGIQADVAALYHEKLGNSTIEWAYEIFDDLIACALASTERKVDANILIRSPEEIAAAFKAECMLFKIKDELAISMDPFNRLCRLISNADGNYICQQLHLRVIPQLAEIASKRNKYAEPDVITSKLAECLQLKLVNRAARSQKVKAHRATKTLEIEGESKIKL